MFKIVALASDVELVPVYLTLIFTILGVAISIFSCEYLKYKSFCEIINSTIFESLSTLSQEMFAYMISSTYVIPSKKEEAMLDKKFCQAFQKLTMYEIGNGYNILNFFDNINPEAKDVSTWALDVSNLEKEFFTLIRYSLRHNINKNRVNEMLKLVNCYGAFLYNKRLWIWFNKKKILKKDDVIVLHNKMETFIKNKKEINYVD